MAPKPEGIELFKGKTPKWRVGKHLGTGACATVHVLEEIDGSPTEWAIKLTPLPKKKTKKGNSEEEINDRLLYIENVMYQNQFQDIQGIYIPKLPPYDGPSATGEADGYRYLIMEKMHSPLSDVVPHMLKQSKSSSTIDFGPIAVQLLRCVEAIQNRKHVVIDIKPENFMLAPGAGKGSGPVAKLASRIRILDLAMVQSWASIGTHRANEGSAGLAGTPLYASLNIHKGETPSRRDDLEALGYVLAELIMKLAAGNASMELPWSDGKSDEDIGQMKASQVNDANSIFYKQLGGPSVVKIMKQYLDIIREYTFKKAPDYDQLASILAKIKVPTSNVPTPRKAPRGATAAAATMKSPNVVSSGKRVTRSRARANDSSDEESSPRKIARDENQMEIEEIDTHADSFPDAQPFAALTSPNDASFVTAPMDWEGMPDENENPEPDRKPKAVVGITFVVESGPEQGTAINLVQGGCESIVVGRKPTVRGKEVPFALPRDEGIDDTHIRVDLAVSKKLVGVVVTDLKSSSGSYIGSEKIRAGKDWKIFRGDAVQIGNSMLRVKKLDAGKIAAAPKRGTPASTKKRAATTQSRSPPSMEEMKAEPQEPALKRRGVRLCVVEGPHMGEEYVLEQGVSQSFNVGSNPTGTGQKISLSKDKSLKATHVHIELIDNKKLKAVVVTDKSKGDTKVNRDTVNKGRAFVNDQIKIGKSVLKVASL